MLADNIPVSQHELFHPQQHRRPIWFRLLSERSVHLFRPAGGSPSSVAPGQDYRKKNIPDDLCWSCPRLLFGSYSPQQELYLHEQLLECKTGGRDDSFLYLEDGYISN